VRILIVAHGVADQSLLGGPGRVATAHAKALADLGHEVHIVTSNVVGKGRSASNPTFELTEGERISVRWVRSWSFSKWPGTIGPIASSGTRAVLGEEVRWADVVHVHEWPYSLIQNARRLAQRAGKPCVVHPHGSIQPRAGWKRALHMGASIRQPAFGRETILAGSAAEASEIRRCARDYAGDVEILPNPMPLSDLQKGAPQVLRRRESWAVPAGSTVLLYAHRIVPNKGLDILIEALARLPDRYHLVVVGGMTSFGETCRQVGDAAGVADRVHLVGAVSAMHIDEAILAADIFVLPARRDTFPLMVLHALACAAPAIITTTCQSSEVLEGAVALSAPEPDALAATILRLDPDERLRLGAAGRQLIESTFAPGVIGRRLEDIYGRVRVESAS
jgi:glycosyltransferase involved in cell wall biosynthesis